VVGRVKVLEYLCLLVTVSIPLTTDCDPKTLEDFPLHHQLRYRPNEEEALKNSCRQ
jgi:hypothetical protein